jgi:hypothetical protein
VTKLLTMINGKRMTVAVAASALLLTTSCGDKVLQGKAPSYLTVLSLQGSSGAKPGTFSMVLESDVVTNVKQTNAAGSTVFVPTVYEDLGQVTLKMALKDPTNLVGPTDVNAITINRYHVDFVRSDGRNTQGVDVPYSFDGAVTGTVDTAGTTLTFVIVRAQSKLEAPLMTLRNAGGSMVISTIAQVTLYGQDQAGNTVSVVASISINFADWGDPA